MHSLPRLLLLLATLTVASSPAQAGQGLPPDPAPADIEVVYPIAQIPLWDLTGVYTIPNGSDSVSQDLVTLRLAHNAKGQLTGVKESIYDDGQLTGAAALKGKVIGNGTATKVLGLSKGTVSGTVDGIPVTGRELALFKGAVVVITPEPPAVQDPVIPEPVVLRQLKLTVASKLCMQNEGCDTSSEEIALDLPADMTGDWTVALKLSLAGNHYRGTAKVTTSTGREFDYRATATRNANTGARNVHLLGTGDAKGTVINLTLTPDGEEKFAITKLTGRLLGQKLAIP